MKTLLLICIAILLISCGDEVYYDAPPKNPTGKVLSFEAQAALERNCQKCHSGASFLSDYSAFQNAKKRVINGSMPPGGDISEIDKNLLIKE